MTGPHLTPEREADARAVGEMWTGGPVAGAVAGAIVRDLLAALDAERAAHQQTRTALGETRVALADSTDILLQSFPRLPLIEREQIDFQVQENQRILGLAVAEADKPESSATCAYCHDPWRGRGHVCDPAKDWRRAKPENLRETLDRLRAKSDYFRSSDENDARKMGLGLLEAVEAIEAALKADKPHDGNER